MTIERFYEIEEGVKGWMVRPDVGSKKDEGIRGLMFEG